ncbi:MAG: T9SS type A sorting domain-containing protein [Saprospiraceae bacterium]|nr:T9SS type A sorting domain-containing protein [Saprospiraceae bacterium]
MRKLLLSTLALLLFAGVLSAQHRTCAAEEVLQQQLQNNPAMRQEVENIMRHTEQFIQQNGAHDRTVVTIPVVVHVVYFNSTQNISDAQIATQIDVLNADFRRTNADAGNTPGVWTGIAADCEVNFCMAQQDPSGNATNGIVRKSTTVNGFSTNDAVKYTAQGGSNIWDRNKYLNLWVCNLSGGLLGYAQFPGGPAATDGVVCDYAYFGTIGTATAPFDKGRTATHEVGHWLNCYHIWGDDGTSCNGTDQVGDTPNQADENYGCPSFPTISCSNGPNGDMFMNYMDYTDDACMNLFTTGQKTRMQALFASGGFRNSLTTSNGCDAPTGCGTPSNLAATNITNTSATLGWTGVSGATSYNLQWKLNSATTWTTVSGLTTTSHNLSGLTAGTVYNFQVQAVCGSSSGSYSSPVSFTTTGGGGGCADAYEPNNSRTAAKTIPVNTTFTAQIASSTDKDWYKFSNTSSQKHFKLELTTLPFDYDLKLYRSATLLATSENAGTTNETIIYNNGTVSTAYTAYIYGYNGASSNTQCYTFRVNRSGTPYRTDGSTDGPEETIEIPVIFENAGFGLFPNPAMSQVTVEVPVEQESDVTVSIIDPSGKVALQQNSTLVKGENQLVFDLNSLPNGVYFVQVRNGEIAKTRKLVVQK